MMTKKVIFYFLGIILSALGGAFANASQVHATIYANNSRGSIAAWPNGATGNTPPAAEIVGVATTFKDPLGVAVDENWIYVADAGNNSIDVFPINGTGNMAPTRSIKGAASSLNGPVGAAVDADWIYVTNYSNNSIDVFPIDGTGNIAPTRSIKGAASSLDGPSGIAVDAYWIYVNDETQACKIFPLNGTGNIAPTRLIHGAATTFVAPYRLAVDNKWIYVSDRDNKSIDIFPINGTGNIAPTRSIKGTATTLNANWGVAVDANYIYVVNAGGNSLLFFPIKGAGNIAPVNFIGGATTRLSDASELAIGAYTVTPSAGANGSISPDTPQKVASGTSTSFIVTPDAGYGIASVTGCGGTLTEDTYTTGLITADCTVSAAFEKTYRISGKVKNAAGLPMPNVMMTLIGDTTETTHTNSNGNYRFTSPVNGTYTITPSKAGRSFTPGNRTVTISGKNVKGQNFTGKKAAEK